jgi:hypothetical protein
MATDAKFVDRFVQHIFFIGGMGIMAGDTPLTKNNPVYIRHPILLAHQIFLVAVAGDTDVQ